MPQLAAAAAAAAANEVALMVYLPACEVGL